MWDIHRFFSGLAMNGVVSPHHVVESGVLVVARGRLVAGHGGVRWVVT